MAQAQSKPVPLAQLGSGAGQAPLATPGVHRRLAIRVAFRGHKKRFFFNSTNLNDPGDGGDIAMRLLTLAWQDFLADKFVFHIFHGLLFKAVIEIGTLSTSFHMEDLEAGGMLEVSISNRVLSEELTDAFLRPSLLAHNGPFALAYPDVMTNSPSRRVIVVSYKARKIAIVYLVGLAALIAVVIGAVVGFVKSDVALAFECSGGIAAVLGLLLMAFFWILH